MTDDNGFVIANEFAHVAVAMVTTPEGDRIEITAPVRSRVVQLDARTLWIIAALPTEAFSELISDAPLGIRES